MKKSLALFGLFLCVHFGFAQQQPFLRVDYRSTLLGDRIDILEGPNILNKQEVMELMRYHPEALTRYQMSVKKQQTSRWLDAAATVTTLGIVGLSFVPAQSSSFDTRNTLMLPLLISSVGLGIVSGIFRRSSRNMTREAVDLYNFSPKEQKPSYFDDGLTYYHIPDFVGFQIRF